jgi:polysaccharide biosynthesis protein PslG
MRAFTGKTLRVVASRLLVATVATAVVCGVAGKHPEVSPNSSARDFIETASIIQEPTTIGSADSDLYFRSQADIDRTLDTLQAMGVQNVRIVIPWAGVQPFNRNFYYWANVDRMVNAATARNMGVLAVLNSTPVWASDRYLSGHPDPDVFAEFAGLAADRYKGKISAYEVWNEPNGITFWNPVDPVAYTRMLQTGYTAIKAADPSATVIGGVVASVFTAGGVTLSPQAFIEQMYDAGAHGYFDAISFHPYNFEGKFSEGEGFPLSALEQVLKMRRLMDENGDGDLKIWATEYGLPTAEIRPGVVVTEEQQAEFIEDFLHAWQDVEGAGPMFIYSTRDTSSGDLDLTKNYGFFYSDWTPKLAAKVIADFAGGLLPERPDRPIVDAAVAFVRAIINATERVIRAGAQLFAAAVDVTVQVIKGLIDVGVRVVKGLANATVAVISGVVDVIHRVIDSIGNRLGPDAATTAKGAFVPTNAALAASNPRVKGPALAEMRADATNGATTASPAAVPTQGKNDIAAESQTPANTTNAKAVDGVDADSKVVAAQQSSEGVDPNIATAKTERTEATTTSEDGRASKESSTASPKSDAKPTTSTTAAGADRGSSPADTKTSGETGDDESDQNATHRSAG